MSLAGQGLKAEEIASGLEIEVALVDVVLANHNVVAGDRDIGDEQLGNLRARAYALAMQDEDLGESAKMVRWLIERDKPKDKGQGSPIIAINNAIHLAQEQVRKLVNEYEVTSDSNGKSDQTPA